MSSHPPTHPPPTLPRRTFTTSRHRRCSSLVASRPSSPRSWGQCVLFRFCSRVRARVPACLRARVRARTSACKGEGADRQTGGRAGVHVCKRACVRMCVLSRAFVCARARAYVRTYVRTYVPTCIRAYACVFVCARVRVCVRRPHTHNRYSQAFNTKVR